MIVKPQLGPDMIPADSPPAYSPTNIDSQLPNDVKPKPNDPPQSLGESSAFGVQQPSMHPSMPVMVLPQNPGSPVLLSPPTSVVFHYQNPLTGETISSLLPPDHPEMICLQEGRHIQETRYGMLGILVAIFWFPLGIGLCLLDRRVRCTRCGLMIEDGLCN